MCKRTRKAKGRHAPDVYQPDRSGDKNFEHEQDVDLLEAGGWRVHSPEIPLKGCCFLWPGNGPVWRACTTKTMEVGDWKR